MQPMRELRKPFQCSYCPKSFKSSNGLKYHKEKIHSDEEYMKMSGLFNEVRTKPPKAIPPILDLSRSEDFSLGILEEFAFIATGPQSPLVQEVYGCVTETECPDLRDIDYNIPSVESDTSGTSPILNPYFRHATPPPTAWSCFLDGTRIQLEGEEEWKYAEDLGNDDIPNVCDPSDGLRLTACERIVHVVDHLEDTEFSLASFSSTSDNLPSLRAEVAGDHPFFAKNKGWTSFQPIRSLETYGMVCQTLERGDVCLPSSHPFVLKAKRDGRSSSMFDFTDLDSNAALTLSIMAKDRQEHRSRKSKLLSVQTIVSNSSSERQQLTKRPMNAFMLFAKRFRLKITKAHPGKDNRAISVILGDKWKSMKDEERKQYVLEAKQLAEEHMKVNPDCWKRKRGAGQKPERSTS